jgi:ABC-type nitrate/sulfonate/bicarbonate transport system substrate-binding protein
VARHAGLYFSGIAFGALLSLGAPRAVAADHINVGKAFPTAFAFVPINVGVESGIMAKYGLDVTILNFVGSAKLQQGIVAGDVDIGIASGTDMAFVVKGVPEKAIAEMAGPPLAYGILVSTGSGIETPKDLDGKKIAVASRNSLVYWLTRHLSKQLGFGLDGIHEVYVSGGTPANIAAMETKQVDGITTGIDQGLILQERHKGRLIVNFGQYIKTFVTHAIFASDTIIKNRPQVLRRFLEAWFATIDYMRTHKAETVQLAMKIDHIDDRKVEAENYDQVMPMFSTNGHFSPAALDVVRKATVELGLLKTEPDMKPLYTEAFLPKKH